MHMSKPSHQAHNTKARNHRKRLSTVLIVVGLVLVGVALTMWLARQAEYRAQDAENEELASYAQFPEGEDTPPNIDWEGLKAVNSEVVGWLYIPRSSVNFPVYQAGDNSKYLRHNADGDYSIGGQAFMDYENTAPGMLDQQTVIYGHHLRNGAMFKRVADMDTQSTFDNTPTIWYLTQSCSYKLEPLFLYYTNGDDTGVRQLQAASSEDFHTYLLDRLGSAVTKRSDASAIIPRARHVLSLVTCNYYQDNGRTVLVCVPKNEALESSIALDG